MTTAANLEDRITALKKDLTEDPPSDDSTPQQVTFTEEQLEKLLGFMETTAKRVDHIEHEQRAMNYVPKILDGSTRFVKAIGLEKLAEDDNGELRLVGGVVLEPDVVDAQGDTYSADEVRKTAHLYMLDFRNIGLQHKAIVNDKVGLVESYTAPVDMEIEGETVKAGTWLITVKVFDDDIWSDIKKGAATGFSIGGFARHVPLDEGE